jgi:hypothetical protein
VESKAQKETAVANLGEMLRAKVPPELRGLNVEMSCASERRRAQQTHLEFEDRVRQMQLVFLKRGVGKSDAKRLADHVTREERQHLRLTLAESKQLSQSRVVKSEQSKKTQQNLAEKIAAATLFAVILKRLTGA